MQRMQSNPKRSSVQQLRVHYCFKVLGKSCFIKIILSKYIMINYYPHILEIITTMVRFISAVLFSTINRHHIPHSIHHHHYFFIPSAWPSVNNNLHHHYYQYYHHHHSSGIARVISLEGGGKTVREMSIWI